MGVNLDIVLGGLVDAVRHQDPERICQLLAPDVFWEGLQPDLFCDGRDMATKLIRRRFAAAPFVVDAVDALDAGENVLVGLTGPGFNGTPGDVDTVGQMYHLFTLRDGIVVRWRDYLTRAEALEAAGVDD